MGILKDLASEAAEAKSERDDLRRENQALLALVAEMLGEKGRETANRLLDDGLGDMAEAARIAWALESRD